MYEYIWTEIKLRFCLILFWLQLYSVSEIAFVMFEICSVEHGICRIAESIVTSQSCSSTPISYMTPQFRQFGHKWGLYCMFFDAHVRNCLRATGYSARPVWNLTSLSCSPTLISLYDVAIPAIRKHLRQKFAYLHLHGFSGPFDQEMRQWECGTDRARQTDFIICPMLYDIAIGKYKEMDWWWNLVVFRYW